jgi:hypothetical protein
MQETVPGYMHIPPIPRFSEIFNHEYYYHPPEDWYVVMTDVVDSTGAIAEGRYKEVNTAGSLAAMAISNVLKDMRFPFLFGGDGMTYLLPAQLIPRIKDLLADTRDMVAKVFNLKLRLGLIQIKDLKRMNTEVRVARIRVSKRYTQAILGGSGIDLAEKLIKKNIKNNPYLLPASLEGSGTADFSGFTCRWKDIPSRHGETISFIVKALSSKSAERNDLLKKVINYIEDIFGKEEEYHPLTLENQKISGRQSKTEARVFAGKQRGLGVMFRRLGISFEINAVKMIERLRLPVSRGGKYLKDVKLDNMINSDFRKFDGTLKMVISCTKEQRERFQDFLSNQEAQGKLAYGLHISDRALITCLIQFGSGEEVHFIDAADGGYASAAMELKEKLVQI